MAKKPTYVFPPGTSPVRLDPDLYLLHSRYSQGTDTLRILYKNIKTNEKILDEHHAPCIPVFFNKQIPKFFEEFVPYEDTYPVIVNYKNRSVEIQRNLFPTKTWKYMDKYTRVEKTNFGFQDLKPGTMFKRPEYLHQQLLFADVPIEHLVSMEYCLPKYQDIGDGVKMEVITPPTIDLAAFDIETSLDVAGNPYMNMNTFVDDKSRNAYAYYLLKDDYKGQAWIEENPKEFRKMFDEKFQWAIDNITLDAKPDKVKMVKETCQDYANTLNIITKPFKTEGELIFKSCNLMFTEYEPDLLMAFNTAFDSGVFSRRIHELGLPIGTFNSRRKKEWLNTPPPIMDDLNEEWQLRNDTIDPKKRSTSFDNISYTHIVDYANAYYSNRKGGTFSSMSLDATAQREVGLGKLDYSHITNHILKLPFEDFITHTIYALIDSILLLICEKVTRDFDSKLAYVLRTKSDMKTTASNNQAITRCIHAEAFYEGNVAGNNWKKYLGKFTNEEFSQIEKITKIDYKKIKKLYEQQPGNNKGDIKGGIN